VLTTMTYRQHILFDQQWSSQRQWQRQRWLGFIICCFCGTVCYPRGRDHNCVSFILHPLQIGPRQRWWHRRWWQWPSQGDISFSIGETMANLFPLLHLSVTGHGIGGINFPDIMARLAKMQDRWSKQWRACLSSPDLEASQISDG